MLVAMVLFLLSDILSIIAPPFGVLLVVRMLPAFLQPTCIAAAIYAAVALGDDKYKNELIGIVISGIAVASVVTVPLSGYVSGVFSNGRLPMFYKQLLVFLLLLLFIKCCHQFRHLKKQSHWKQLVILKDPIFLLSMAFNLFLITAWFCTYSYIAEYLQKVWQWMKNNQLYDLFIRSNGSCF